MQSKPGTYVLILQTRRCERVDIGQWGSLSLKPGFYLYVGSAFGPGGVKARVHRHWRKEKALRWHIDYLSNAATPLCAWHCYSSRSLEHRMAVELSLLDQLEPINGFGCSDCRCVSHLFYAVAIPDMAELAARLDVKIASSAYGDSLS